MPALMALPGHVLQSELARDVFWSGKQCAKLGFHAWFAPVKLSLALTGTAGRGAEKAVKMVSNTALKLLLEVKVEQDDLLALLSEADLEHAYRQADINFKVSSYALSELRNQMHAKAPSASSIQRLWRRHLEHKRFQAVRKDPIFVEWREESTLLRAHLLQKLSNESLGGHKQHLLQKAQKFIDRLGQQVQNQAWQVRDQEKSSTEVQDMQHDVTQLQGQVQVLEGEKAEGQTHFKSLQAEGVILLREVTNLTGQKAKLVQHIKVVEVRATGLEVQVTDLTSAMEDYKQRARVAREEQSQQQKGHSAEVQQVKDVVTKQDKEAVTRQGLVDSLQKQLAEASTQVSSLTMNLEATQQSHNSAVQGHTAELHGMKELIVQKDKESSARQGHVDSLQMQLAEALSQVASLTMNLEATHQSHNKAVQGHSAELHSMKDLIAQKDKESSGRQGHLESLQKQLADRSSQVSSLTMDLKTARQTPNIAVQVLPKVPSQLRGRSLLDGLKDRGKSSSPSQAAPGTPAQQTRGADAFAAIDALLCRHASKDATSIVSSLGVADEPPPVTSASQVGALSKEMMLGEPPGTTTLPDSGPQGGSISPTTADYAGSRAARYSPQGVATSTMPLGCASQAASTCHLPQDVPQLQEAQETVSTPQGVRRIRLREIPGSYQISLRKNFDALKHGGHLVLDDLLQLDERDQILTACAKVDCSATAANKFANGLLKAKQKAAEIAAREAAKGARRAAAASATVASSAPHAAPEPSSADGRASNTAPPPGLTVCAPPGFENMGGNVGISGQDSGRRFGYGDDAAAKQLPQLPSTAGESPGLPVPLPAQSSAPGKSSWAAVASVPATAQTGPVRRRQPHTAAQRDTPLQVKQQPRAQQPVGQGRASALGVGLQNIAASNNCCVNVMVQVLKHCPALQKWLLNVALPDEYEGQEVVEELARLFNSMDELAAAPESMRAADPQGFREALAALDPRFPQGPMLDAADILEVIYEVLDKLALALGGPRLFHSAYQEHVFCPKCQKQTCVVHHSDCMLIASASQLAQRKPPLRMGQHLFQMISTQKSCDTDEGGCGVKHVVQRTLQEPPPAVVTVQLQWTSSDPSSDAVQKTLGCIDMVLVLADVYPDLQRNIHYQLQEVVCFLGRHFVSYCRQSCGRWVKHDDVLVKPLADWNAVCIDCRMGHCHPTILMYGMV